MMVTSRHLKHGEFGAFVNQLDLLGKVQCALSLNLLGQPDVNRGEGIDLLIPSSYTDDMSTIGVITECYARDLWVPTSKVLTDFYVLVSYDEDAAKCEVLGWTTAAELKQA